MNVALLQKIKRRILRRPDTFRMDHWNCGTAACIAGHACAMNGQVVDRRGWVYNSLAEAKKVFPRRTPIDAEATRHLGITFSQFRSLCEWDSDAQVPYWPEPFRSRFKKARLRKDRAKIAADRIDRFIATKGAE